MPSIRGFAELRKEHSFPKQRLVVTSIGEVLRIDDQNKDGMNIDDRHYAGCVNVPWLAEMLGVAAECVTKEQIDFALDAQMLTFCTNGDEYALVKKVWDLQEHNDSRFRIWGQTDTAGVSYIWLVTEFATLVTNKKMWRELIDLSRFLSGSVRNINKAPHCDHTYYHYGTPEQTEVFGPDHGKMERQVEMYWNVLTWKEREIIAQREEFAVRTQSLWDSYGVGVC